MRVAFLYPCPCAEKIRGINLQAVKPISKGDTSVLTLKLNSPLPLAAPGITPKPQNFTRIICLPLCSSLETFILTMKAVINSTH